MYSWKEGKNCEFHTRKILKKKILEKKKVPNKGFNLKTSE